MFFQSSALFGAGRYRGGIEGRFLLNAAQTPSTGTLNLLGAVVVVGFSIPHTTPGLRIGQEKAGGGLGGLTKVLGVYGGKRRPDINWQSPEETA